MRNIHFSGTHTPVLCIILRVLCIVAVCTFLFTACGKTDSSITSDSAVTDAKESEEAVHAHTPSEPPVVVKESTCTEDGEEEIVCSECGETLSTEIIPATGHQTEGVEWVITSEATCSSNEVSALICSVCGETVETREEEGTQLEHAYGQWKQTKKPTCAEAGEKERTCTVCGYVDVKTLSLASHTYGDWVETTAPTCTTAGVETRTCTVCGNKETQSISALGHTWKDYGNGVYWTVTKQPTCIADGEKMCECTVCGHSATKSIAHNGTEHKVTSWTVTKVSTCTTEGIKSGICTICGKTVTALLPLADHSYSTWAVTKSPTTTSEGTKVRTCSVCGKTETKTIDMLTAFDGKVGDIITINTYIHSGIERFEDVQYEVLSIDSYGVATLRMLPYDTSVMVWTSSIRIAEEYFLWLHNVPSVDDCLYYYYNGILLKQSETVNHLCEHNPVFLTLDEVITDTTVLPNISYISEFTITCSICGKQYKVKYNYPLTECTYSENFKSVTTTPLIDEEPNGVGGSRLVYSDVTSCYVMAVNMAKQDGINLDIYHGGIDDSINTHFRIFYQSDTDTISVGASDEFISSSVTPW